MILTDTSYANLYAPFFSEFNATFNAESYAIDSHVLHNRLSSFPSIHFSLQKKSNIQQDLVVRSRIYLVKQKKLTY